MVNAKSCPKFIVNNDVDVVKIVVAMEDTEQRKRENVNNRDNENKNKIIIYDHIRNVITVKKLIRSQTYNTHTTQQPSNKKINLTQLT